MQGVSAASINIRQCTVVVLWLLEIVIVLGHSSLPSEQRWADSREQPINRRDLTAGAIAANRCQHGCNSKYPEMMSSAGTVNAIAAGQYRGSSGGSIVGSRSESHDETAPGKSQHGEEAASLEQHSRQLLQAAESSGSDRQEAGTDNVKGQGTGKRWKKRQARTPIFSRDLVILPTEPRPSMLMNEENPKEEEEEVSPETTKSVALEQQLQAHFTEIASAGTAESEPEDDLSDTRGILKVCIMSADFWGMKAAGGTATAYHLLAGVLAASRRLKVTFLGANSKLSVCQEARAVNSKAGVEFDCLEQRHFQPEVVQTYPYEQLSHAVLAWLQENSHRCDVVHGHEWGGAFLDAITALHFRQIKPGMRMAVQPHGGHFWSTQGQVQRPMDVVSLRIDNAERMANQLNDVEISPTNYMTAFLRQRGWRLPPSAITIPNVIPEVETAAAENMGKEKPVWRLAFFSRLEERKGIKLFVDAVTNLNTSGVQNFEVFFVGSEAKIDMRPSSIWLKEHTAAWPWKTHLKVGASRDEALEILSSEGMLLVLCSLIDNMPYVVAEAAVKGIPFVAFDAGGVLEMFSGKQHPDNVVLEPTLDALTSKLRHVLNEGKIKTVQLSDSVTNGRQRWLQWHLDFAENLPKYSEEDTALASATQKAHKNATQLQIVRLDLHHNALELWEPLCNGQQPKSQAPILLLPPEYEFLDPQFGPQELYGIATIGAQRSNGVGALAFGAVLPNGKHSFPTSPTWMLYAGDDQQCIENAPLLIRAPEFCSSFLAEARVFRHYYIWVMAMLLNQQDMQLHTFPRPMFKVVNFTMSGYSCMPDKVPVDRALTYPVASNLYRDAEELLRNLHLAPFSKPLVSLIDDFPVQQKHKGWQFGYLTSNTSSQISFLKWQKSDTGLVRDGKWACGTTQHDYPSLYHSLLHPCANDGGNCCGDSPYAPFLLRYESFFHSANALLVLAYEVWPMCGDGLDFVVRLTPVGNRKPQVLLRRGFDPDPNGQPNRQKVEWRLHIRTGDVVDFVVEPRANHDCDGLYIVDVQIWNDADMT